MHCGSTSNDAVHKRTSGTHDEVVVPVCVDIANTVNRSPEGIRRHPLDALDAEQLTAILTRVDC